MSVLSPEVDEVLQQVKSWPAQTRLMLAQRVLETLSPATPSASRDGKGPTAQHVLGLWNPGGAAPTDEECRQILIEELQRKHSA